MASQVQRFTASPVFTCSSYLKWVVLFGILLLSSCMNMRVVAKHDSNNPVPPRVTKVAWVWGLVQPKDIKTDSNCESICQVTAQTNLAYILVSAVTLGIIVPLSVEYECCAFDPGEDEI